MHTDAFFFKDLFKLFKAVSYFCIISNTFEYVCIVLHTFSYFCIVLYIFVYGYILLHILAFFWFPFAEESNPGASVPKVEKYLKCLYYTKTLTSKFPCSQPLPTAIECKARYCRVGCVKLIEYLGSYRARLLSIYRISWN